MACPTGMLIDIANDENEGLSDVAGPSVAKSAEVVELSTSNTDGGNGDFILSSNRPNASTEAKVKLCGYLTKISTSGLIKTSKTRWFSYNPDSCELFYFRVPESDRETNPPMGRIPIRRALFNFTAADLGENIFTVTADGNTHILQACDRETLLWWLQELQSERRTFNLQQTDGLSEQPEWHGTILGGSLFWVPNATNINGGLLDVRPEEKPQTPVGDEGLNLNIIPRIESPPDSVGDKAATQRSRSATVLSSTSLATLSNKIPSLGNFNSAFSNAGGAAIKGLMSQAQKLRPPNFGRRMSDGSCDGDYQGKSLSASSSAGNLSTLGRESTHSSFIAALKETVQQMKQEMELMKIKLQTKEESIEVLKMDLEKHEQLQEEQRKHPAFSKDDYKLRSEVISVKLTNERLEQEKEEGKNREKELEEKTAMMEEMLKVKDSIVVQLSNEMYVLESSHKSLINEHKKLKDDKNEEFVILTPTDSEESMTELKDRADGFMLQNKFLNNEILELANLRQIDAKKIQSFQDKVHHQEAEHCQLHSKYLVLLSEMNKPRTESVGLVVAGTKVGSSDEDRKEMVKILIREALSDTDVKSMDESSKYGRHQRYDQYGFSSVPEDDAESTLLSAASRLEKRSSDILHSLEQYNDSVAIKWQNYLAINKELQKGEELKSLIRLGVPHELRPQVWSWLVNNQTNAIRQKLELENSYYNQLVHSKEAQLPSKQIELDLLRTLPNNKHFSSLSSSGIDQLRRVLRAYSIHNPSIGYCQGLNRIAAVALLYLAEEEAFWCLVAIVECIMPQHYYSTTLTASQADQRVFRELMAEKLPRLHRHLETSGVDSSLITFNWLLCIYCDNVPPDTMLHIWDCLLNEGSKVLFRYGLAFFKYVEDEILQLTDYMAIFNFLRLMSHRMHDVRTLTQLAFSGMNPFPMRRINRLRQLHMEKVNAELKELDELRKGFVSVRRDPSRRDIDSDDD